MSDSNPDAQPYRTPAEVVETGGRGILRSPIAWILAVGVIAAAAGAVMFTRVSRQVEDFGGSRMAIDDAYEAPVKSTMPPAPAPAE